VQLEDSKILFPKYVTVNDDKVAPTAPDVCRDFIDRRKEMKKMMK
jgi:hypothetical protein